MHLQPFQLERYFARHEFSAKFLLSSSDCDGLAMAELLSWADDECRERWEALHLGYTESLGLPALRQEIAGLYRGIEPDEVLVLAPEEGIFLTLQALLTDGDHVICTWPGYQSLSEVPRALGCEVERWTPDPARGWRFDVGSLAGRIRPSTKAIIANFPHNPTGAILSPGEFQDLVALARRHGLYLFSDEMYRFLEFAPADRLPAACEVYERAVSLAGMSKVWGLAGSRIGWVVIRDRPLFQRVAAAKDYTTICSAAPSEVLALIALRSRAQILARHLQRLGRNLERLDAFFRRHTSGLAWTRPRAGTIAFPELRTGEPASEFCRRAVEAAGIMLLPSTVYDYGDQHFRLGFGRENLPEALAALEEFLAG
jgi:aspartate/methionine/tyrosine aminotransferase